jgi:transporter family-2 protein
MVWLFALMAVGLGLTLPVQAVINGRLRSVLDDPIRAGLVSVLVSTLLMAVIAAVTWQPVSMEQVSAAPWWVWTGGIIGAIYVAASLVLISKLGAAFLFALLVVGQMLSSIIVDHYGWLGVPIHTVNPWRVLGAAFLVAGVVLIRRF